MFIYTLSYTLRSFEPWTIQVRAAPHRSFQNDLLLIPRFRCGWNGLLLWEAPRKKNERYRYNVCIGVTVSLIIMYVFSLGIHPELLNLVSQHPVRQAFRKYHAGLEQLAETSYGDFVVPFGWTHKGESISDCHMDRRWMLWTLDREVLTTKV